MSTNHARSEVTPENRAHYARYRQNARRNDMTDKTPATKAQAREVRKQFEKIFATLTASEANLLLYRFEDIFDWRTPIEQWSRIVFVPASQDVRLTPKKGGAR